MSDTPLTDAAKIACGFQAVPESFFQHACQLERKNAALRADLLIEEERSIYWRDNEGKAIAENAALRADKERLDWIAKNRSVSVTERPLAVTPDSLRASIDAARKEAQI